MYACGVALDAICPEIVMVFPEKDAEIPEGNPDAVPILVAPVVVMVMLLIVALGQILGEELAAKAVFKFFTPFIATFKKLEPDAITKFPLKVPPVAVAFNLTYTVVAATVPFVGVKLREVENPVPEVNEISYPVGAVMVKFELSPVADTDVVCSEETMPAHVEKPERDEGDAAILAVKLFD